MIRIPTTHDDHQCLNKIIEHHLDPLSPGLTAEQEEGLLKVILQVAASYQRTISNQAWGPGWD